MDLVVSLHYVPDDARVAAELTEGLRSKGYHIQCCDLSDLLPSSVVILLLSANSVYSESMLKAHLAATGSRCHLFAVQTGNLEIPGYLKGVTIFELDHIQALYHRLDRLSLPDLTWTLGKALDVYLQRADLHSAHTLSAYRRSVELFLEFVGQIPDRRSGITPENSLLRDFFSETDLAILLDFVRWMLSEKEGRRPYKLSTVELRIAGVLHWFQFLLDQGEMPRQFDFSEAKALVRDELDRYPRTHNPVTPHDDLSRVVHYYDALELPGNLRGPDADSRRVRQWELTRMRNSALLHALAETGGRISEILSLNVDDFGLQSGQDTVRVEVRGKNGHSYILQFNESLPAIWRYLQNRQVSSPLFVSHDPHYDGNRMSRVVAWRVVQRAARAVGLGSVTPQDLRHWRAKQLLESGYTMDEVQAYLGHQSAETTRLYYGED